MVRRPTWILLIVLALVVGAYLLIKKYPIKAAQPTPTVAGATYLITQADGVLQSLQIVDNKGAVFQMQRDLSKTWVITAPTSSAADQGLAGAAESQVGALSIIAALQTPPLSSDIGLGSPTYSMTLGFVSGASHKIEVGSLTPTSSGYYVRFDNGKIYVISQSGIDALSNLLKSPPYPPTATPVTTPESTITPTP